MYRGFLKELIIGNNYYWLTADEYQTLKEAYAGTEYETIFDSFIAFNGGTSYYIDVNTMDEELALEILDEFGFDLRFTPYLKSTDTFSGS